MGMSHPVGWVRQRTGPKLACAYDGFFSSLEFPLLRR